MTLSPTKRAGFRNLLQIPETCGLCAILQWRRLLCAWAPRGAQRSFLSGIVDRGCLLGGLRSGGFSYPLTRWGKELFLAVRGLFLDRFSETKSYASRELHNWSARRCTFRSVDSHVFCAAPILVVGQPCGSWARECGVVEQTNSRIRQSKLRRMPVTAV